MTYRRVAYILGKSMNYPVNNCGLPNYTPELENWTFDTLNYCFDWF